MSQKFAMVVAFGVLLGAGAPAFAQASAQALQASDQASLVQLAATARRCNQHLATLAALRTALEVQPQGQGDPACDNQAIVQLQALHARIGVAIESATRRSPEFAHLMHVQGLPAQ